MSLHDAIIKKGWKCGSGAVFIDDPRKSEDCICCEPCTAVKGIILEDAECRRFISGDDY